MKYAPLATTVRPITDGEWTKQQERESPDEKKKVRKTKTPRNTKR